MSASEALSAEDHPVSDHAQVAPLTATDLANHQALVPAVSSDGSTGATEEDGAYDMCTEYADTQDDDYVLVALQPVPYVLSRSLDKGEGTSNQ